MGRLWGMVCVWHGRAARMPNGVQCAPTSLSCFLEGGGEANGPFAGVGGCGDVEGDTVTGGGQ